jgi:hypothetical protein
MGQKSDIKINNTIVLATVAELTKCVISKLDGDGIDTQVPGNEITHDVLNKLIASRIRNRLSQTAL